jgi:mannose-6-phosphate isomerase-like protein (cupin superfamily)
MRWRFSRNAVHSSQVGVSRFTYEPDARMPFGHRHREQEEVYVVVSGSGHVNLDGEVHDVSQWDAVRVAPGTARCFEAGPKGLEFLAFGTSTGGIRDVESLPDWWG